MRAFRFLIEVNAILCEWLQYRILLSVNISVKQTLIDQTSLKRARGFTIVELLIVIVVIGILAAIVIVAYNGIQTRASDVKRAAAIAEYVKILGMYKSENGEYPDAANVCLGTPDQYPLASKWNNAGRCWGSDIGGGVIQGVAGTDSQLITALQQYVKKLPDSSYPTVCVETYGCHRGPMYSRITPQWTRITYMSTDNGANTCAWGGVIYGNVSGGYRQCMIDLQ